MSKYSEKLKDPRWQKKRLEILERDDWKCQRCEDEKETLHVHHTKYIKEQEPWEYEDFQYITLCSSCHEVEHNIVKKEFYALIDSIRGRGFLYHDLMDFFWVFKIMFLDRDMFNAGLDSHKENMASVEKYMREKMGQDNE